MKRLALVLAAVSVLGTGCIVANDAPPCARSLTLGWQFRDYANGVTADCNSAGVYELDVYVNDGFVGTFPCSPGGVSLDGLSSGSQRVTVEGIDKYNLMGLGANRIAYRDEFTVNTTSCGDHPVTTEPAEAQVNLDYGVDTAPTCVGATGCSMRFQVLDLVAGNGTIAANSGNYPTIGYGSDVVLYLPVGDYSVDFMQVVTGAPAGAVKSACSRPTFAVRRPDSGAPPTQIVPAVPLLLKSSCP